jgi:CBS domain-containing protein/hemerythrin
VVINIEQDQAQEFTSFDALTQDTLQVMLVLGKLSETLGADGDSARVNNLFSDLVERVANHFLLEEEMMEAKDYPGRHWHRVVHRELLNEMRLALAQASAGKAGIDRALLRRVRTVFSLDSEDDDVFRARAKLGLFKEVLPAVHPADLAAALPDFDLQQRSDIFGDLQTNQASGTLEEVEPKLQRELVASLSIERVAELIDYMTPAQAAGVLRNLTPAECWAILHQLGPVRSRKISALMEKRQKETLLHLATLRYMRVEPEMSCAVLMNRYREMAAKARVWRYIYVITAEGALLGVLDVRDLLMAPPAARVEEVMMTNIVALGECDSVDIAAAQFERYDFDALPVVGTGGKLMGVLVARDVMTVGEW